MQDWAIQKIGKRWFLLPLVKKDNMLTSKYSMVSKLLDNLVKIDKPAKKNRKILIDSKRVTK
jgi:hypothetical protein